jgi:3-oxoacyl-[acyl-carrier-protein] synthase-1
MIEPLYVTCLGLICPVGLTPESAAAAMRAGITGFVELPYVDNTGEPIVGAVVSKLPTNLNGRARLVELLAGALTELQVRFPPDIASGPLPLLLCTREPDRPGPPVSHIVAEVETRLGLSFRRKGSGHIPSGSVSVFRALAHAGGMLANSEAEACLVAAVDTYFDRRSLRWLDQAKRLKTPAQSDGIIPGEAAGVILVSRLPITQSTLAVRGLGFAEETATVLNDEPLLGKGMALATQRALAQAELAIHDVDWRLSDVAGEAYGFEELVLAQARLMRQTRQSQVLWHPAGSAGDCGAAAGLLQLAWIQVAFTRSYAPGPFALAHCSAPQGDRAVALLGNGV